MVNVIGEIRSAAEVTPWLYGQLAHYEAVLGTPVHPVALEVTVDGQFLLIVPDQDLSPAVFGVRYPVRRIRCTVGGVRGDILRTIPDPTNPGRTRFTVLTTGFAAEPGAATHAMVAFEPVLG